MGASDPARADFGRRKEGRCQTGCRQARRCCETRCGRRQEIRRRPDMKFTVFSSDGTSSSEKDFANIPTFEGDKGLQAVKEVIVAINANNRQGTHSTKTRGEVS